MEEQEFVIKGTIPEMTKVLQKDFDMSYEEAKFFVYIMIARPNEETANDVDEDELATWYLTEDAEPYEGEILNTHLVINFTTVMEQACHPGYTFFVKFLLAKGIDLVLLGAAELAYNIVSSITKVNDTDYCVYARIVELCIDNKNRLFDEKDIVTANRDGKCDYQSETWECTYLGSADACTCNMDKVRLAFNNLEKENIIKKAGQKWTLVR